MLLHDVDTGILKLNYHLCRIGQFYDFGNNSGVGGGGGEKLSMNSCEIL